MSFMQAMLDGKTIQHTDLDTGEWVDVEEIYCGEDALNYRIKPESKYRPFKNAEECWAEMLKHQPFGWIKDKNAQRFLACKAFGKRLFFIGIEDKPYSYSEVLRDYTFADGAPFGVKVEK